MTRLRRLLGRLPTWVLVTLVRGYQMFVSPLLGHNCRFQPTCSQYFGDSVRKYGAVTGAVRGVWRICRCHPFSRGGHDPP